MTTIHIPAVIETFLARQAHCTVCDAIAWEPGDLIESPVFDSGPFHTFRGHHLLVQCFRCVTCNNLVWVQVGRIEGCQPAPMHAADLHSAEMW